MSSCDGKSMRRAEKGMIKIGDFSRLARVSVKTLRHYGELGLLRPAWIDRFTSYRYYTLDQLGRLNRILALKDLGFSLQQILELLSDDLSVVELRGMLRMKCAEVEQEVQAQQARLALVTARLQQIEREGRMPDYEVILKAVPPQRVIGIRATVTGLGDVQDLYKELQSYLQTRNVPFDPAFPGMAIYYDVEYRDRGVDVEVAAPIPGSVPATGRMVVHGLPAVEIMACAIHHGSYERLTEAYEALIGWAEANAYRVTGPSRELYLQGPEAGVDSAEYVTEVQFPLSKEPVSSFAARTKERSAMEPKIMTKAEFTVVGMRYHGKNENNEIAQVWQEFIPRMGEIKHRSEHGYSYGVCRDLTEDGQFEYMAGVAVDKVADVPEGMADWTVPAQKYAVFTCTLPTLAAAYEHAFRTWLPQSDYQRAEGPDFELYDESFDAEKEDSELFIYVPIE